MHTHIMRPVCILHTHAYYVSNVYIAHARIHARTYRMMCLVVVLHRACIWLVLGLHTLEQDILQVNMQG